VEQLSMALRCKRLADVCLTIQGHNFWGPSVPVLTSILNLKNFDNESEQFCFEKENKREDSVK
jgi:hypothetical protein